MYKNVGASIVLGVVIVGFISICTLMVMKGVQESATLNIILGAFAAKFTDAVQYFTGSTASSKAKDQTIADVATKDVNK